MKSLILIAAVAAGVALGGCQKASERAPIAVNGPRGRYVGVGLYVPGEIWRQLVRKAPTGIDPTSAGLDDDEQVIVVLDTATGELRQCGNLSGHCIGHNPWAQPLDEGAGLPAHLLKHAKQLETERLAGPSGEVTPAPSR